jgi:hypothetical protein
MSATAALFGTWHCASCLGGDGKPFRVKGALTRCPKCNKGPAPGARTKLTKGSGKGAGAKGKDDKGDGDKYFALVQQSLKGIQVAMSKQEKRIDAILGSSKDTPAPAAAAAAAPIANPALEAMKTKLKELQQHFDHAKDEALIEFLRPKIEELAAQIKVENDRCISASEQTFNLAGDTLKDFQATRTKVQKLGPAILKCKGELDVLMAKQVDLEKLIADKNLEGNALTSELAAAEGKLEKFAKAALASAQDSVTMPAAPTDISALIKGAQQLTTAAENQLSAEGAGEFKKIMIALQEFNSKLPTFFATNLLVPDDEGMEEDIYLDDELLEAAKAGEDAVAGAAPDAKVEQVRCHAYTTKLNSMKRARVLSRRAGQCG